MTNYSAWDSKAKKLLKEAEHEDEIEKAENDKVLGLEGGPKGPPTEKSEKEMKELVGHSDDRKKFINWSKEREVSLTHEPQDEVIPLAEIEETKDKAVRISGSEGVTYLVGEGSTVVKLIFDKCKRVRVLVHATLMTSTIEACRCEEVDFELTVPIGTFQVDECIQPVRVLFAERDHVGRLYHQNSPGLSVGVGYAGQPLESVGKSGEFQLYTWMDGGKFLTGCVRRGEGEFPVDLPGDDQMPPAEMQPEPETAPAAEERRQKAAEKRNKGNDMFRANDFLQAAMEYTGALELDPTASAVLANRAQCWLKLGDHEKALDDAKKTTEIDPSNAKGWFRQGMALHAMKRYQEAIPALLAGEKLDPSNKQIQDAIKMAQLMARKEASSGY